MTQPTSPAVWIDGDPLMEAIAAAVWEQCNTEPGSSVVDDDPRNIAAVAATAARQTLGTTTAAEQPTPVDRRRTTWPAAVELQQAADNCRAAGDPLLADWLDETANALSWLAPYRDNEPGYGMWETAMVVARKILGTAKPETEAPEAYPAEVSFIGEIEESEGFWMYLTADRDRAAVEKRIASRQKQFPTWADGRPVRCRIVRKTTTYTVEPTP